MRVTETVDYSHVQDRHQVIHARLENWRRWVIVRLQAGAPQCSRMGRALPSPRRTDELGGLTHG